MSDRTTRRRFVAAGVAVPLLAGSVALRAGASVANIIAMFDAVRKFNGAPQHV